jgi:hypothetical protein
MDYSAVSIVNLALGRIGARGQIVSLNENSPNAVKARTIWNPIFQEVLCERDWKFAKTRVQLQLSPVTPLYAYRHAWALPVDFLRFVRPHKRPHGNNSAWLWSPEGWGWYHKSDPPFWPHDTPYVVETLTAGWLVVPGQPTVPYPDPFPTGKYALTDYGCADRPAAINYIRLISDYTQLMPGFVNCLANRLAMELAVNVTEDKAKREDLKQDYKDSLNSAEAQNECYDFSADEAGSDSWERAGRWTGGWWQY